MIAEVLLNLPVAHGFDYAVPEVLRTTLRPGMRVMVPVRDRKLVGVVHALRTASHVAHPKAILRLVDPFPVIKPEGFRLAQWIAEYYGCSLGEACTVMVPAGLRLRGSEEPESGTPSPGQTAGGVPDFTAEQRAAFAKLEPALRAGRHETFLLHGVTGSGKTELYLRAIDLALQLGRSAIVLVPEIAMTPQTIDRFRERFGPEVVLWHSRLTARQRALQWQRVVDGRSRIVVGTRSAVFAPVIRPGVIVLDEEHDPSYKQDQSPRYHARDVALARADIDQAIVILGSATPSVESYYRATMGGSTLLELTQRVHGRPLPRVEVIDMREEMTTRHRMTPFSDRLRIALQRVVDLNEQAILLLNRRGFARVAQCPACGLAIRCAECTVPMIYHADSQKLICHYCSAEGPIPDLCPSCQKGYLRLRGAGTERIESELHRLFPQLERSIARMDTDTTKQRDSHRRIYEAIKTQEIDLLVGTQMVAKGLDIPQVTLVGIVSADTALNLPDFRAGEMTFDLLTQVAGRAGRGDRPGQVLIQTYAPDHYAIQAASRHDYRGFYQAEIEMRRQLQLPPFVHFIELTVQGSRKERVQDTARALYEAAKKEIGKRPSRHDPRWRAKRAQRAQRVPILGRGSAASRGAGGQKISLLGPAPHRILRLRGTFRWRVVLKAASVEPMMRLVRKLLGDGRRFHSLPVIIDVDPL